MSDEWESASTDRADDPRASAVGWVEVVGEIDGHTVAGLREALAAELAAATARGPQGVVVDVTAMTFCGAAGLATFARAALVAEEIGTVVAVAGLSRRLQTLTTTLWPAPHPSFHPDPPAAVAALGLEEPHPRSVRSDQVQ